MVTRVIFYSIFILFYVDFVFQFPLKYSDILETWKENNCTNFLSADFFEGSDPTATFNFKNLCDGDQEENRNRLCNSFVAFSKYICKIEKPGLNKEVQEAVDNKPNASSICQALKTNLKRSEIEAALLEFLMKVDQKNVEVTKTVTDVTSTLKLGNCIDLCTGNIKLCSLLNVAIANINYVNMKVPPSAPLGADTKQDTNGIDDAGGSKKTTLSVPLMVTHPNSVTEGNEQPKDNQDYTTTTPKGLTISLPPLTITGSDKFENNIEKQNTRVHGSVGDTGNPGERISGTPDKNDGSSQNGPPGNDNSNTRLGDQMGNRNPENSSTPVHTTPSVNDNSNDRKGYQTGSGKITGTDSSSTDKQKVGEKLGEGDSSNSKETSPPSMSRPLQQTQAKTDTITEANDGKTVPAVKTTSANIDKSENGNQVPPIGDQSGKEKKVEKQLDMGSQTQDVFMESESPSSGHFMAYFLTAVVLCVAGYVVFHNKQKIIAFIVEGRNGNGRRSRRPNSKDYKKLQPSMEEVMPSLEKSTTSTNYIY